MRKISFVLANDESKYYPACIALDLPRFLKARGLQEVTLDVQINCSQLGSDIRYRLYNLPSKTIKKKLKLDVTPFSEMLLDESHL